MVNEGQDYLFVGLINTVNSILSNVEYNDCNANFITSVVPIKHCRASNYRIKKRS